ncbi:uncharacterized protein [Anabrus simplex]|uniref:uncharacterized protein n=1 Tax=Anabrus simplex TaxID=316456 RepID=UPI0035A3CEC4
MPIRLLFLLAVSFSSYKTASTEDNETKQTTLTATQPPAVVQQEVAKPGKINSTQGSARIIAGATATLEDSSKLLSVGEQRPYQDNAAGDKIKHLVSQRINIQGDDSDPNLGVATSSADSWQRLLPKSKTLRLGWQLHFQGTRRPLINFGNPGIADILIMAGLGSILNPIGSVPVKGK